MTDNISSETDLHGAIEAYRDDAGKLAVADPAARRYAIGDHDDVVGESQRRALGERANKPQRDNVIGQSLTQIAGRLLFEEYLVTNDPTMKDYADTFARKNQIARKVVRLARRAMTDGNTAASLAWRKDQNRPVVRLETWWDGTRGMFVARDDDDLPMWAVSDWEEPDSDIVNRRTIYFPDRILRCKKQGNGWITLDEIAWKKRNDKPLGVPVAHFANGDAGQGVYAPSTVTAVMGMQDALNAVLFDLMAASALTGLPIFTAAGVAEGSDLEVGIAKAWVSENPDAKFGVLLPGALEQLLAEKDDKRASIAAEFPVPSYRIGTGDWPSGLALARSDSPMIAGVKLLGDVFAPELVYLMHKATEMENTFSGDRFNEDALIRVKWREPDQVDPGTQAELDRTTVDTYTQIEQLTPTMMAKTGKLSKTEITSVVAERRAEYTELGEQDLGTEQQRDERRENA